MRENRKLRKSRDRIMAGVAGGIAEFLGWPSRQVRIIWLVAGILTGGTALFIYLLCAVIFPPPSDFDLNDFREQ